MNDPCEAIWELADWLTIEQAATLWCCGSPSCAEARAAAIASAVERGEIEARDSAKWQDAPAQLVARGDAWRVQVSRVSLAMWAESLPVATRPASPAIGKPGVRMDTSHLRALDALARKAGIDFAVHGSAAALVRATELAGLPVNDDAALRIAKRIRALRESGW